MNFSFHDIDLYFERQPWACCFRWPSRLWIMQQHSPIDALISPFFPRNYFRLGSATKTLFDPNCQHYWKCDANLPSTRVHSVGCSNNLMEKVINFIQIRHRALEFLSSWLNFSRSSTDGCQSIQPCLLLPRHSPGPTFAFVFPSCR